MNPSWLVAFDFSADAEKVIEKAVQELETRGGTLYLLHVVPEPSPQAALAGVGSERALLENSEIHLKEFCQKLGARFPHVNMHTAVRDGDAVDEIIEAAKELEVDRIVVGTHGRRGLGHVLMGSIAERIVRLSPVSVLVIKADA